MAGCFVGGAEGGAAIAMVAVAKRLVVVVEKRIIGMMRYDREEEEGGWDDLAESETCIVSRGCKVYLFYTTVF